MRCSRAGLLFCVVLLAAGVAAASPEARARARLLHRSAVAHYNLGEFSDALGDFREAYRLDREPAILINIGQCQRQLHDAAAAALSFRAYLREATDAPDRAEVERLITEMERQAAAERAAGPSLDGNAAPDGLAVAAPRPAARDRGRALRVSGLALGGVGLGLVGGGVAFTLLARAANDDVARPGVFHPADEDRRDLYQTLDVVCFAVGGAALAAGTALFVVGRLRR